MAGNKKPQTFKNCLKCEKKFGPVQRLSAKYCSQTCHYGNRKRVEYKWVKTPQASKTSRRTRYLIEKGILVRPSVCEFCKQQSTKIEAAHENYESPLAIKWLCRSCHVKWDKYNPKGACVARWEEYTGKKHKKLT